MHPFTKFREEQKKLAAEIRLHKQCRKKSRLDALIPSGTVPEWSPGAAALSIEYHQSAASMKAFNYRHYHIAYCELRGRTREQIEPNVHEGNEPDEAKVTKIKAELQIAVDRAQAEWEAAECTALAV